MHRIAEFETEFQESVNENSVRVVHDNQADELQQSIEKTRKRIRDALEVDVKLRVRVRT